MRGLAAAMTLLVGCNDPVQPPKLTPEAARVVSISPAGADLRATLEATNPNKFDLAATDVETSVTIGGRQGVARAVLSTPLVLPAGQRVVAELPIRVEWTDRAQLGALAGAKQPAPYVVNGTSEFRGGKNASVRVPFQVSGVMSEAELAQTQPR